MTLLTPSETTWSRPAGNLIDRVAAPEKNQTQLDGLPSEASLRVVLWRTLLTAWVPILTEWVLTETTWSCPVADIIDLQSDSLWRTLLTEWVPSQTTRSCPLVDLIDPQ